MSADESCKHVNMHVHLSLNMFELAALPDRQTVEDHRKPAATHLPTPLSPTGGYLQDCQHVITIPWFTLKIKRKLLLVVIAKRLLFTLPKSLPTTLDASISSFSGPKFDRMKDSFSFNGKELQKKKKKSFSMFHCNFALTQVSFPRFISGLPKWLSSSLPHIQSWLGTLWRQCRKTVAEDELASTAVSLTPETS